MKITRRSMLSGVERSFDLDVTEEQIRAWRNGAKIQDAMPHLTDDEREFMMTGIVASEWDQAFGGEG